MAGNPHERCKNRDPDAVALLPPLPPGLEAGRDVRARGAIWRVERWHDHADCRELHLRGADGGTRVLLWPFDRPEALASRRRLRVLSLASWTKRAGPALARDLHPLAPRAAFTGQILDYQLAPAIAIASGVSRVLLADEVGLGKTVQAGWILADLLSRSPDIRALVAVPAGLRDQWASELAAFFSIAASRVDATWLRAAVADRPADVSPWAAPGVYLGSIDFLKRADVAASLAAVVWDLLVVDEAHTAAAPTDRHGALVAVAATSRRVVLVTATPYSGDTAAFLSMTSLGTLPGEPPPLMFRRSREDVGDPRRRRHRFATVRITRAEFRLQRLLERYTGEVWREADGAGTEQARLAMTVLRKRALSSPAALLRSLVRRQDLLRGVPAMPAHLSLFGDPPESDDALPEAALATPGLADAGVETRWLSTLVAAAERVAGDDSKLRFLLRLRRRLAGNAAIVFTEYRDTLRHLAAACPQALQLHGGLTMAERAVVQRQFNEDGGLLIATDAAAEGLNLQRRCRVLVNFELPWNPARLEQRIGRVDRIGQRRTVHAVSIVARDTAEDLVVAKLARRLARVAASLGDRDRLASFLTDARVARSVVAGAVLETNDDADPPVSLPRASPGDYPSGDVAASLARRRVPPADDGVVVAGIRRSRLLGPGCVVIVRAAAVCNEGLIAERVFPVRIADPLSTRPATRAAARARAREAVERAEAALPRIEAASTWFAEVVAPHRAAVASRIGRERALQHVIVGGGEVQPGLFDRRALDDLERLRESADERRQEHERRLRVLVASLDARLECVATAVLIVWR